MISWILDQMIADPESPYSWDYGVNNGETARARRVHDALLADGIPAVLGRVDTYAPGQWRLSFPVKHYRRATVISDNIK